ncbi:MAG: hemerythrin domain-containing protein [Chitinophagaceae bacterium]
MRFNIFNMIHKALRAMLYDTALTLQQTHFGNTEETEQALDKIAAIAQMFEQHANHEDHFVFSKIEKFEPQLVTDFEDQHVTDHALAHQLKTLANIVKHTTIASEREIAASALSKAFLEFMIFNLEHMAKEESIVLPVLWAHYTDEELLAINHSIVAVIPPHELAISSRWMVRGINNAECIGWLGGMKHTAPEHIFQSVWKFVETELPESRRIVIEEAVMESPVLA